MTAPLYRPGGQATARAAHPTTAMPNARGLETKPLAQIQHLRHNLLDRYQRDAIVKELLQNAEDAGAATVDLGWTPGLPDAGHELLRGPALFAVNDGRFSAGDAEAICQFGLNFKAADRTKIGRFGLGLKSVFHLCEAFFFLANEVPPAGGTPIPHACLLNPWTGTGYHDDWDHFEEPDAALVRDYLAPLFRSERWFCLWLPLRREAHCERVSLIPRDRRAEDFRIGDGGCDDQLLGPATGRVVAGILPLLRHVRIVRGWTRWTGPPSSDGWTFEVVAPPGGRSLFPDVFATPVISDGTITVRTREGAREREMVARYALAQTWVPGLTALSGENDWPQTFSLDSEKGPLKEKAEPHAAACLIRRPDGEAGRLEIIRAVFLPLRDQGPGAGHPPEYSLILHGCKFVDAGRGAAFEDPAANDVRTVFNRRLEVEGIHPLILPALARMAAGLVDRPADARPLTAAVAASVNRVYANNRATVCGTYSWVYRWRAKKADWELVSNGTGSMLEIPDFGRDPDLPGRALPNLVPAADEYILTPAEWPRLTRDDPMPWPDALLAAVIAVADPKPLLEGGGAGLLYYSRFLTGSPATGPGALAALGGTLRGVFTAVGSGTLRDQKEVLRRVVGRLPADQRRGLPLPANWPDEVRHQICRFPSGVVIVPEEFEPNGAPGAGRLTTDEAAGLLELMSEHVARTRNCGPAWAVLRAATDRAGVLERTAHIPLWLADQVTADAVGGEVVSLAQLRAARGRRLAVAGRPADDLRALAAALGRPVLAVAPDLAADLFPAPALPAGDGDAVLAALDLAPPLASPAARRPLISRLLAHRPPADRVEAWRRATRYLLHGTADLPPAEDLYLGGTDGVWARLVAAARDALGRPGRILPADGLHELLSDQHLADLGVRRLDPDGVGRLLAEVGPDRIAVEFTAAEQREVLHGLRDHPAVLRRLPLHDGVAGGRHRIGADCFWVEGRPLDGPLAARVTMLRQCVDPVSAAIQRTVHDQDLTPAAILRLALDHHPADHWDAALSALAAARNLPGDLRDRLARAPWLPTRAGAAVAPERVLHDPKFDAELAAVLAAIPPAASAPVGVAALAPGVATHPGFRELARQLFPGRPAVLGRLGGLLRQHERFRIGRLPVLAGDGLTDWLAAFQDAPPDVMAVRDLVERVHAADRDLCVSRLLPALRDGDLPADRLERVLRFLRDRHHQGVGPGRAVLQVHNNYLRLVAADQATFSALLPRLRLLNEVGSWADPAMLCLGDGLDPACTLDAEQREVLAGCVDRRPDLHELLPNEPDGQGTDVRICDRHFMDSVQRLREYFDRWRVPEEVAGWGGAFLALLGDYERLLGLANEFLGIASPGRTTGYVRTKAGMRDAQLLTAGATRPESLPGMMARQRVLVRLTDPSRPLDVMNLLGSRISVNARAEFDTLLIGFGLDRIDCPYLGDFRVRCLHLRQINPAGLPRRALRDLVVRTGELVLRVFFGQEAAWINFASVLEEFSGDDAFGVRMAQESFLGGAQAVLDFLGLAGTRNGHLRDLLRLAEAATSRRSEEAAIDGERSLPGRSAMSLECEFRDRVRQMVTEDAAVQFELVAAVRRKVREFRYEPRSVLFELFQNADDAYVERGGPTDTCSVFVFQQTASELVVLHNGRPINRSPAAADRDAGGHRHDLRKMLSLGHSDKGFGPTAGEVTGRFGLGFKSVFLLTDHPRVASGRLAFEILGGVYPRPVEPRRAEILRGRIEEAGLPRETGTIFELQVRDGVTPEEAVGPFRRLAHLLVVFARRIRSIRCGADSTTWVEKPVVETGQARVTRGFLRLLGEAEWDVRQALVIRCGSHGDVVFGLNETGFTPFPPAVPSIWVTAPTTEQHGVGYLVNAPLDLDVGRCQVTWDAADNADRLANLGVRVCDALTALFDAGLSSLDLPSDVDTIWRSLWDVVSRPGHRRELHDCLMWGQSGAARRFYDNRPALPTGLQAEEYSRPTTLGAVRSVARGVLDTRREVFRQVAAWETFRQDNPPGSIVSHAAVGRYLPGPFRRVDLRAAVRSELRQPNTDPARAERLGRALTPERLRRLGDEAVGVRAAMADARFQNAKGDWVSPAVLVAAEVGGDEALRAAFAPRDCLLAAAYSGSAVEFFLACRGPSQANTDTLAGWVLAAGTAEVRSAALRYLERGRLGTQVRRALLDRGIAGTWLEELTQRQMVEAGLNECEQRVLAAGLGPSPAPPPQPAPPQPVNVFARIADWWRTQAPARLQEYNRRVYPDGRPPLVTVGGPGTDVVSRTEWLKLFVTGIVQTVGRVTARQNRSFFRLCVTERWFATLADPTNGPREWLAAVERYIDRHHADGIRYFHWLRHFVGVATVSRHLDAYAESFLAINTFDGRFTPRDVLTTRTSRQFQFGGPDAPTLAPILGIGACFVLRELTRLGLVTRVDVHPYCFAPVRRLCEFLRPLGLLLDKNATVHERSRSIYDLVARHHPEDPTFGNAFDIPLLLYLESPDRLRSGSLARSDGDFITLWDGRVVPRR